MKRYSTFTVFILMVIFSSCKDGKSGEALTIMSWNVQNLFDDVDNGTEYREFDPGLGEWNYDCFHRKASALADIITTAVPGGPDIVVLQEIENENALLHLNENCLKASGYDYALFLPTENSAIGTAILSRYAMRSVKSHAVNLNGEAKGRNIAEVELILPETGEKLVLFVNHWKSKLGGAEETEPSRVAAAEKLADLIRLSAGQCDICLIAAGDFNESHDEWSRTAGLYLTAITADGLAGGSGLDLFNPWDSSGMKGSYCYDGKWETIDQFFLSSDCLDGEGWDYSNFSVVETGFNSSPEGYPLSWQSSTGTGYSDHFPILLELSLSAQSN